jgi:FkbM family methyltransferase
MTNIEVLEKTLNIQGKTQSQWVSHYSQTGDDNNHLYTHDLNKNSIVFDIGAYLGEFAIKINQKYQSKIYCFEPIFKNYNLLENNTAYYKNIFNYNFGVSNFTGTQLISYQENSSSEFLVGNEVECKMIKLYEFMKENNINEVDLVKINVEGKEYKIMSDLLSDDKNLKKIKSFLIQFHIINSNSINEWQIFNQILSKNYIKILNFPFVWEQWIKK